jgi:hypothetical protein
MKRLRNGWNGQYGHSVPMPQCRPLARQRDEVIWSRGRERGQRLQETASSRGLPSPRRTSRSAAGRHWMAPDRGRRPPRAPSSATHAHGPRRVGRLLDDRQCCHVRRCGALGAGAGAQRDELIAEWLEWSIRSLRPNAPRPNAPRFLERAQRPRAGRGVRGRAGSGVVSASGWGHGRILGGPAGAAGREPMSVRLGDLHLSSRSVPGTLLRPHLARVHQLPGSSMAFRAHGQAATARTVRHDNYATPSQCLNAGDASGRRRRRGDCLPHAAPHAQPPAGIGLPLIGAVGLRGLPPAPPTPTALDA